jgi:hypothetical protein
VPETHEEASLRPVLDNGGELDRRNSQALRSALSAPDRATPNPRPRCRFGRPHVWTIGFYDEIGVWAAGWAKCFECGQVEWEGLDE